jgi:hypothetical protein
MSNVKNGPETLSEALEECIVCLMLFGIVCVVAVIAIFVICSL